MIQIMANAQSDWSLSDAPPSGSLAMTRQAIRTLIDRILFGLVIVGADGRVVVTNALADRILARNDGLGLTRSKVTPARVFERAHLSRALAKAIDASNFTVDAIAIGRSRDRPPYAVLIVPLLGVFKARRDGNYAAALLIIDFEARVEAHTHILQRLFGLTSAEARLAIAVAEGQSLNHIATKSGRAIATLRSQLQATFKKLAVKRQLDVARVVHSLPALRSEEVHAPR
jgi:hypothetical protein